ncbi:MAG TPA: MarR family transcriptional regulator [Micromonosporaceae bacterium]|nr:MarR family transcriptional regulator [Micromonosporaceae bacterium]
MDRDDVAMRMFVEQVARAFADWGFPRMAARVLMAMFASDEPALTAGELAERLGVSPAAISGAVRYLIQINMIAREPVPGSRRDVYRLVDDSWYEVSMAKMTLFKDLVVALRDGVEAAGGPDTPAGARLADMRDYFQYVQEKLPDVLAGWRERDTRG